MFYSSDNMRTLEYAVAFNFPSSGSVDFRIGETIYRYIGTVYDRGDEMTHTLVIVYNYNKMKYELLCLSDEKIAKREISILPVN